LADAADREEVAVAGKRQGPDAADGAFALPWIVGVKRRNLETLSELARFNLPDTDRAVPIGAGQVFPIRSDGHDVECSDMALRRSLVMSLQRSHRLAGLRIPQFDKHVVASGDQQLAFGRRDEITHPAGMSFHDALRLAVAPPDQIAVEAGRDN